MRDSLFKHLPLSAIMLNLLNLTSKVFCVISLPLPILVLICPHRQILYDDSFVRIAIFLSSLIISGIAVVMLLNNENVISVIKRKACSINMRIEIVACAFFDILVLVICAFDLISVLLYLGVFMI